MGDRSVLPAGVPAKRLPLARQRMRRSMFRRSVQPGSERRKAAIETFRPRDGATR